MNPLVALKEKFMIKPNIEDRERVAVVIKGNKPPRKIKEKDVVLEEKGVEGPVIEMKTDGQFDRAALLKKLAESKKLKVTMKPILEVTEEKRIPEPIPISEPTTKIRPITNKKRIIIEPEDEEMEQVIVGELDEESEEFVDDSMLLLFLFSLDKRPFE
jgi:hypothetical protein